MSKFSAFMKANKKVKENEKFAPTASLLGSDGTPVSIEVKTTVTFEEGHNWSNTKAAIAEAVDAYFLELRKNWSETSQTIVRVSQIENRILGVDGVVDVTGTKLNGTASNMTLTEFCIPKLGGVSA